MRLLFLGNNRAAVQALEWLRGEGTEIAGVVLHPENRRRFGAEMLAAANVPPDAAFDGDKLSDPDTLARIAALGADTCLSVFFGYILRPDFLRMFPRRCLNVHPAYLPYNRGAYPNVWSIVDGTPAGATIHYIDEGVDTGDIVARRQVDVLPTDTGETLYARLEEACLDLLKETWPAIRNGTVQAIPQLREEGTTHRVKDVAKLDRIDLDRSYTGRELIDILRARTYPPYPGAYFEHEGKRIYLRLQLTPEES